jgi:hypothetical protein
VNAANTRQLLLGASCHCCHPPLMCRHYELPCLTCRVVCCLLLLLPPLLQDETTRYRAVMRSQNLFNKSHSVSHNIITGEPRRAPPVALPEP